MDEIAKLMDELFERTAPICRNSLRRDAVGAEHDRLATQRLASLGRISTSIRRHDAKQRTSSGRICCTWATTCGADREVPERRRPTSCAKPYLRCDKPLWDDVLDKMVEIGMNMVVIDLGEGVRYDSHPELAVHGSWTPRAAAGGAGAHPRRWAWSRSPSSTSPPRTTMPGWGPMLAPSPPTAYYDVCKDLIAEVIALFDKPRFFHLGMDEETAAATSATIEYAVMRQYDLWWHDLYFLVEQVEKDGVARLDLVGLRLASSRRVLWQDAQVGAAEQLVLWRRVRPRSCECVKAYVDLEEHGYDQVPTGSNWIVRGQFAAHGRVLPPAHRPGAAVRFYADGLAPHAGADARQAYAGYRAAAPGHRVSQIGQTLHRGVAPLCSTLRSYIERRRDEQDRELSPDAPHHARMGRLSLA